MQCRSIDRRFLAAVVLGGVLAVTGCQSGSEGNASGGGGGMFGFGSSNKPDQEKVLASELTAYCPRVSLRQGTAYFNTYAKGGEDDKSKIIYQASISDVTRTCSRADGMLNMKVAVAGRVVPGPMGTPGTVNMPIRIAVVQGTNVLYSQLHHHQVQVGGSGATQFIFSDPNVSFPIPSQSNVIVFAGYDEGPPKPKKTEEAF